MDLADGTYLVHYTLGDKLNGHDLLSVSAEGTPLQSGISVAANQWLHNGFLVNVAGGALELGLADGGGTDPNWVLNGLEVRSSYAAIGFALEAGQTSPRPADGATLTRVNAAAAGLPDGALVTVSVANGSGTIDVANFPDASPIYAGVQRPVAGGTFSFEVRSPLTAGAAQLKAVAVDGSGFGENAALLAFATPAGVRLFDFNGGGSPTQPGYTGVLPGDLFATLGGHGWSAAVTANDHGVTDADPQGDLRRDLHYAPTARTFQVQVPNGAYYVHATVGDRLNGHDQVRLTVEGVALPTFATSANQWRHELAQVTVSDGVLTVLAEDLGGGDPNWVLNGLEVRPMVQGVTFAYSPSASAPANGSSRIAVTGTVPASFAGRLITVATSLGTVAPTGANVDQSGAYAGLQVLVDALGQFQFDVVAPTAPGTATLTVTALDGLIYSQAANALTFTSAAASNLLFDFNASAAGPTQTIGAQSYQGVLPTDAYSAGLGYGWTGAVNGLSRATESPAQAQAALRTDFHYAAVPRTFQTAPAQTPTGMYFVHVTLGDGLYGHDQMQVRAEPGTGNQRLFTASTNGGQWHDEGFFVTVDGDGLQLEFSDLGGGDPSWVANGVEVRTAANVAAIAIHAPASPPAADGMTNTVITGTGPAGALLTLRSDVGTLSPAPVKPTPAAPMRACKS